MCIGKQEALDASQTHAVVARLRGGRVQHVHAWGVVALGRVRVFGCLMARQFSANVRTKHLFRVGALVYFPLFSSFGSS